MRYSACVPPNSQEFPEQGIKLSGGVDVLASTSIISDKIKLLKALDNGSMYNRTHLHVSDVFISLRMQIVRCDYMSKKEAHEK